MLKKFTMLRKDNASALDADAMGVLISPYGKRAKIPAGWHRIAPGFCGNYTGKEFADGYYTVFKQEEAGA